MKTPLEIRNEIDHIDDQIVDLFLKRMDAAREIADAKRASGLPVLNSKREEDILSRLCAKVGPDFSDGISLLYKTLFSISRTYQEHLISSAFSSTVAPNTFQPKIAVVGMGLIGGSLFKAATKANYTVVGFDKNDPLDDISTCDLIFIALSPSIAIEWIQDHSSIIKKGAILVDTAGVKGSIFNAFYPLQESNPDFFIVPAHPMAGKEKSGFENSDPELFRNASMILTPFQSTPLSVIQSLESLFKDLGFAKTIVSTPDRHDTIIAYTSQLCHIISSAYLRDPLAAEYLGFSAGSFRDMIRVGAPEPNLWTELFYANKESLLPVLSRFIQRLNDFRSAIENDDIPSLHAQLSEGRKYKENLKSLNGDK